MQSQRRFLHQHERYARPEDQRGKTINLAELIICLVMPGNLRYHIFSPADVPTGEMVIDARTGCKALVDFDHVDADDRKGMIESFFSTTAFEVLPGVWVA